jgi:hypothetical protein
MGAFEVSADALGLGALIGGGLTAASLAALGISAADIAGGAGSSFIGFNGSTNGFYNLGSYNQAIDNGAHMNAPVTGTPQGSIYQNVYNNAIGSGATPEQATQAAQTAMAGGNPSSALSGLGTSTTPGAGISTAPQMTVLDTTVPGGVAQGAAGGGLTATQSGLLGAGIGAGAGLVGGSLLGSSPGAAGTPGQISNTQSAGAGTGAGTAAGAGSGSLGSIAKDVQTYAPIVSAGAGLASTIGGASGGVKTSAPNPASTAGDILGAELQYAPQVYNATAQYSPLYNQLQNSNLNANAQNLTSQYGSIAPQLQGTQGGLNAQQAAQQQALLSQYGAGTVSAYQSANPQLQALQNQYTKLAESSPSPVGQIQGAGNWGNLYNQQVQNTVANNQVGASLVSPQMAVSSGNAQTVNQLNQTAQQQLALGSSMSQQQASTVANQVLSNYNQMGRANDPTAIAGLATGLDTYGQQLLTQRETNAANAANLQTAQNSLGVQAGTANLTANQQSQLANQSTILATQQANQQAALSGLGMQGSALSSAGAQGLAANQSNQQAQLSNAQYQQSLLGNAAGLAQSTAATPLNQLYTQSQGLTNSYNTSAQAGTGTQAANSLSSMYNPFNSAAYQSAYNAQASANTSNASTNAGLIGGGLSLLGSIANGYLSSSCWAARAIYGMNDPKWLIVRRWMLTEASPELLALYRSVGPRLALRLGNLPRLRARIKASMDAIIERDYSNA